MEKDGSAPKLFVTTWRETSRATQHPFQRVCLPFAAGARHPEHCELFMPALTLGARSGLHCHSDPHGAPNVDETAEAGKRLLAPQ